jgi:RNA polymerase sigma-70 factor (ECF subfamily)
MFSASHHILELSESSERISFDCRVRSANGMTAINDLNDVDLLRQMLSGDEESLAVLYRRRQGSVYRFALQMSGSRMVAEDVTQEVFLFLMRDGRAFDPTRGSLVSFLLGVTRNYVLRRLRGEHYHISLSDDSDDEPIDQADPEPGPLEDLTRTETIENVRKAVLSLPEKYREVVVLCEIQEMSYVETAEVLGCAIGTVRSRLHRARALLLAKLKPAEEEAEESVAAVKSARCFA